METENELTTKLAKTTSLVLPDVKWTKELDLVKEITAKNCTETEFKLLLFMAQQYKLNPLKKEIWAVKYENRPALIFVSRDGLLNIAHRSGQFGSMETTVEMKPNTTIPISATCTIYRKDYDKPFKYTAYFDDYNTKMALWLSKPRVMIAKVAESSCLRRAFNISNLYTPEEFEENKANQNGKVVEGENNEKKQ